MRLVGGLRLGVGRPLARVLDRQRRRDHHDLAHAAVLSASTIIRASRGSSGSCASCLPIGVSRRCRSLAFADSTAPSSVSSCRPSVMLRWSGGVDERERGDVAEADRRHLQDDRGEVGAQDLGLGELRPCVEVSSAYSRMQMPSAVRPAAALALVRRGLRDRLDRQALDLGAVAVPGDARRAGVDDVLDARHGQRGLGDVGREHDPAAAAVRLEDAVLLGGREPCVQREDSSQGRPRFWANLPLSASAVSRISRSPQRKTRMSPGGLDADSSSTASQDRLGWSRSSCSGPRGSIGR